MPFQSTLCLPLLFLPIEDFLFGFLPPTILLSTDLSRDFYNDSTLIKMSLRVHFGVENEYTCRSMEGLDLDFLEIKIEIGL